MVEYTSEIRARYSLSIQSRRVCVSVCNGQSEIIPFICGLYAGGVFHKTMALEPATIECSNSIRSNITFF